MLQIFDELDGESTSDDSGLPDIPSGDEGVPAPIVHEINQSPQSPSIIDHDFDKSELVENIVDSDASTVLYISESSDEESVSRKRIRPPDIVSPGPTKKHVFL